MWTTSTPAAGAGVRRDQDDAAAGELDEFDEFDEEPVEELDPDDEPDPEDEPDPDEDEESDEPDDEPEDPESEELLEESAFDSAALESDDPLPFTAPARLSVR